MQLGNKKIFRDKKLLTQMLNLRLNGLALSSLAWLFACDRDSITKQCQKYGIEPHHVYSRVMLDEEGEVIMVERIVSAVLPKDNLTYKIVNGERINLGKSYAEYVRAAGGQYPPRKSW